MASALVISSKRVPRYVAWDALFVGLSIAQAAVLLAWPSIPVIALGLWWNANTIAHNFIHRPFFHTRALNRAYSLLLSLLLGIPQSVWRQRHLLHHAGLAHRLRLTPDVAIESGLVLALWTTMAAGAPRFFLTVYLPGWAIGLALCQLHGHYEHARGTTSHYGRIYNLLFFNDGFHVEHHQRPTAHWTELDARAAEQPRASRWPAVLRWLDAFGLEGLERLVLRSARLQAFVLRTHERAIRRVLTGAGSIGHITVVGGGLFPRTALVLRRVAPAAEVTVVDADATHLAIAQSFLGTGIRVEHRTFRAGTTEPADLLVIPLSFRGDRRAVYARPPARAVIVHDWIWRRTAHTAVVSWWLLKRVNLILR